MAARFTEGEGGGAIWLALGGRVPLVVPPAMVVEVVPATEVVVEVGRVGVVVVVVLLGVGLVVVELVVVELVVVELLAVELFPVESAMATDAAGQARAAPRVTHRAAHHAIHAPRRTRRPRSATPKGWPLAAPSGNQADQIQPDDPRAAAGYSG
jgi:hypothetical protein